MDDLDKGSEQYVPDKSTMSEDYFLVVELPEDDPFYEKKKKLLHSLGSGPKIHIHMENSPRSKWINTTLEMMLSRVRIIQLNEEELYFNGTSPVEFYSNRNELESLNSIFLLIGTSLSGCPNDKMRSLQDLLDATVDMIKAFGDKNKVATRIERCNCHAENHLLQWGENHGMRTKLQIAHVEGAGRGLIAVEDLEIGEIVLEIPQSIIISEEQITESDMFHVLKEIDGISLETMLLLWSMKERYNPDSKFWNYFATLPETFNTGLSFGRAALTTSEGTLLFNEITQAQKHLQDQYDELFPVLSSEHPAIFHPDLYTWDRFLWACELWYSNGMKIKFTDGKLKTCLVPIAGFLNHSLCPHITHYGKVDLETSSLKFSLSRPCGVGEQCYLSYGNFSSSHLITFYGFLPKGDNPCDIIPLDIDISKADDSTVNTESDWTTHMVRGTWLTENRGIFDYALPQSLLDHLREALSGAKLHTKTYTRANLENEIEVLDILRSIFEPMMDKLESPENMKRENLSWDMKLALEYKDLQRCIVSSILTSCFSGLNILQNELRRCKDPDT